MRGVCYDTIKKTQTYVKRVCVGNVYAGALVDVEICTIITWLSLCLTRLISRFLTLILYPSVHMNKHTHRVIIFWRYVRPGARSPEGPARLASSAGEGIRCKLGEEQPPRTAATGAPTRVVFRVGERRLGPRRRTRAFSSQRGALAGATPRPWYSNSSASSVTCGW